MSNQQLLKVCKTCKHVEAISSVLNHVKHKDASANSKVSQFSLKLKTYCPYNSHVPLLQLVCVHFNWIHFLCWRCLAWYLVLINSGCTLKEFERVNRFYSKWNFGIPTLAPNINQKVQFRGSVWYQLVQYWHWHCR